MPHVTRAVLAALAILGTAAVAALAVPPAPAAGPGAGANAPGQANGQLGLVGMDHVGITVPDIDEAVGWFEDVMGCVAPLTFGPFGDPTGTFMQDLLDVHPRAVIEQITQVRCGAQRQHRALPVHGAGPAHDLPEELRLGRATTSRSTSTDIDAAVAYMVAKGVAEVPRPATRDRGPGSRPVDQLLPDAVRNVHRADQLPERHGVRARPEPAALVAEAQRHDAGGHERPGPARDRPRRHHRARRAGAPSRGSRTCSAASSPLAFGPFADPTGTFIQDLLDVHPRAVVERIQHVRCGNGPSVELFQYTLARPGHDLPPELRLRRQAHRFLRPSHRQGGRDGCEALGAHKLLGPLAVTDGPAAGQSINYFRTPFGTYVELISYPQGEAYAATAPIPLWDPRDNRP